MAKASDCIFCKIAQGEIQAPKVYEDDQFFCVQDIRPQAKTHLLVIPKEHVISLDTAYPVKGPSRSELVGKLFETAAKVAREQGLLPSGFRSVINTNENGGQT